MALSPFIQNVKKSFDAFESGVRNIYYETIVLRRCLMLHHEYPRIHQLFTCIAEYDEDDSPYVEMFYDPSLYTEENDMPYTVYINVVGLFIRNNDRIEPIDSIFPVIMHAKQLSNESNNLCKMFQSQVPQSFFH